MIYQNMRQGRFLSRPNRFIAHVELDGTEEICHVKNTGRCRELLVPGCTVYVQEFDSKTRKTRFDLIGVQKGDRLINMDSQAPNKAFGEFLKAGGLLPGLTRFRPECKYGDSRFDFYIEAGERKAFIEVKGVTLEEDGAVYFPDAPTERGVKHIRELCACREAGYEAFIAFVIQMDGVRFLAPNDRTHPAFGEALREAKGLGVGVLAYDCKVAIDSMVIQNPVPVKL